MTSSAEFLASNCKIRRKASRLMTRLPVQLETISGYQQCVMRDLSLIGMRVRFSRECYFVRDLRYRTSAQIRWNQFETHGELIWLSEHPKSYEVGIEFFKPIDRQIILQTRSLQDEFWRGNVILPPESEIIRKWIVALCA